MRHVEPIGQLREILNQQQRQMELLEEAVKSLEEQKLWEENEELRRELAQAREALAGQAGGPDTPLGQSSRRMAQAVSGEEAEALETLTAHEARVLERLKELRRELSQNKVPAHQEMLAQLKKTEAMAKELIAATQGQVAQAYQAQRETEKKAYRMLEEKMEAGAVQAPNLEAGTPKTAERLGDDAEVPAAPPLPVTGLRPPEPPVRKKSRESLEMKIGSRITNIAGLAFILLAVIFGLHYSFVNLQSDILKGVVAYGIGAVFLGIGEFMNRRQGKTPFSIGLCAGGVSILFASTAVSYFSLGILSIPLAVGICIGVTAVTLLFSMRYSSQLIAVFALIGGYLPMVALEDSPVMLVSAMLYFLLLNLLVLLVAAKFQWQTIRFFSLLGNSIGMVYLVTRQTHLLGANALYVLANFGLYVGVILVYPMLRRASLRRTDTVLLAINAVFACGTGFYLVNSGGHTRFNAPLALGLCLLFFGLAKLIGAFVQEDASGAKGLFYCTSLTFLVIGVPLYQDSRLITLGWLAEGVALFVFGLLKDRKWYKKAGIVVSLLCLVWFIAADVLYQWYWWNSLSWISPTARGAVPNNLFIWKYAAVTLGALVMVGALFARYPADGDYWKRPEGVYAVWLKYGALVNLWWFCLYITGFALAHSNFVIARGFWQPLLFYVITLGLGAGLKAVPLLRGKGIENLSLTLYGAGFLIALYANSVSPPFYMQKGARAVATLVLVLANLLSMAAMYDGMRILRRRASRWAQWVPVVMACFSLVLTMQVLMVQVDLSVSSMVLSFVLLVWAWSMILYGFVRRMAYSRRFGLALLFAAVTKLFLLDLSFLRSGQRIVSYFVFGLALIGISYVYQVFSQKLLATAGKGEGGAEAPEEEEPKG